MGAQEIRLGVIGAGFIGRVYVEFPRFRGHRICSRLHFHLDLKRPTHAR